MQISPCLNEVVECVKPFFFFYQKWLYQTVYSPGALIIKKKKNPVLHTVVPCVEFAISTDHISDIIAMRERSEDCIDVSVR